VARCRKTGHVSRDPVADGKTRARGFVHALSNGEREREREREREHLLSFVRCNDADDDGGGLLMHITRLSIAVCLVADYKEPFHGAHVRNAPIVTPRELLSSTPPPPPPPGFPR